MTKKGKSVSMESSPSSSSFVPLAQDFKHQILLKDYKHLVKETEAKKMKLQKTIEKKLKLTAEIKFLRRKYQSFEGNPSQETKMLPKKIPSSALLAQPQISKKKHIKMSRFALPQNSTNTVKLSRFAPPQDLVNTIEHFGQHMNQRTNETKTIGASALFDLNKISIPNDEGMDRIQTEREHLNVDNLTNNLNLSIYKDIGNGSSHAGNRKSSWQDHVALRA